MYSPKAIVDSVANYNRGIDNHVIYNNTGDSILCVEVFPLYGDYILNLSAWLILPIMDAIAKYLSYSLPILQITWFRFFFSAVITGIFIYLFSREIFCEIQKTLKSSFKRNFVAHIKFTLFLCYFGNFISQSFNTSIYLSINCYCIISLFFKRKGGAKKMDSSNCWFYWCFISYQTWNSRI